MPIYSWKPIRIYQIKEVCKKNQWIISLARGLGANYFSLLHFLKITMFTDIFLISHAENLQSNTFYRLHEMQNFWQSKHLKLLMTKWNKNKLPVFYAGLWNFVFLTFFKMLIKSFYDGETEYCSCIFIPQRIHFRLTGCLVQKFNFNKV